MKKIGVAINQQEWIEGQNTKVHKVKNQELFNMALALIETQDSLTLTNSCTNS